MTSRQNIPDDRFAVLQITQFGDNLEHLNLDAADAAEWRAKSNGHYKVWSHHQFLTDYRDFAVDRSEFDQFAMIEAFNELAEEYGVEPISVAKAPVAASDVICEVTGLSLAQITALSQFTDINENNYVSFFVEVSNGRAVFDAADSIDQHLLTGQINEGEYRATHPDPDRGLSLDSVSLSRFYDRDGEELANFDEGDTPDPELVAELRAMANAPVAEVVS